MLAFWMCCVPGTGAFSRSVPTDTLMPKALAFLEKHLEDLRQVRSRASVYTGTFTDLTARVACDICRERDQPLEPHRYAFAVEEAYPDGFMFTSTVDNKEISVRKLDRYEYEWRIPATRTVPPSPNRSLKHLASPFKVRQVYTVKYLNGVFSIRSVEGIKGPEAHLMLDLFALKGMGTPAYGSQNDFVPEVASSIVGAGLSWYFASIGSSGTNVFWLKTGLRIAQRTDKLTADELRYEKKGLRHTEAIGAGGLVVDAAPEIDVSRRVGELNETVRSTQLTIPLGLSKRFALGKKAELSLEAEVNWTLPISRSISGSFVLDQTGKHHMIGGELMDGSDATDLTYPAPEMAIMDASTGERIDFFVARTTALNNLDAGENGQLGFACLPALFFKKKGAIKYMIGIRLQWEGNPRNSGTLLDQEWFVGDQGDARPTLGSLTDDPFRLFAGVTFATRL